MNGADIEELIWWAASRAQIEGVDGMRAHLPEPQGDPESPYGPKVKLTQSTAWQA